MRRTAEGRRGGSGGRRVAGLGAALLLLRVPTANAQSAASYGLEPPPLLPREREIALARSAAPPEVSAGASVLVLERGRGYVEAVEGTNGVTCYVSRSRPGSLEPHCFDAEGTATILAMELRRYALREEGRSREEIEADIARGLLEGRFRLPSRPAMSYMMSSAQELVSDEGRAVGRWKPHLMIYYPYLRNADLGLGDEPPTRAAFVVDEGGPTANILVVVEGFVDPAADGAPGGSR